MGCARDALSPPIITTEELRWAPGGNGASFVLHVVFGVAPADAWGRHTASPQRQYLCTSAEMELRGAQTRSKPCGFILARSPSRIDPEPFEKALRMKMGIKISE